VVDAHQGRTSKGAVRPLGTPTGDALKRFAIPFFGTRPLDEIGPKLVRAYIAHLEGHGLTRNSVRKPRLLSRRCLRPQQLMSWSRATRRWTSGSRRPIDGSGHRCG
jgi:hypothetical protein